MFAYATGYKLLGNSEDLLKGIFVDIIITVKWQFEDDFQRNSSTYVLAETCEHVGNVAVNVAWAFLAGFSKEVLCNVSVLKGMAKVGK